MSIGETLAEARQRAGLSVSEVSERTRVRETIIRGIEDNDYAACGGDFYARGHIRAIAQAVGEDPVPLIDEFDSTFRSVREFTAAEAFQPLMPMRKRERRRVRWTAVLAVIVLGVLGFASYKFVAGVGHDRHSAATTTPRPVRSQPAVAGTANAAASAPAATPSATPSPTPSPSPTTVATRVLTPASVAAFGPAGTADGDNAATATRAISGDAATPWYSDWYASPDINGQQGTGLLLDMGRKVTITSVRLSLGASKGASLQLRVGATPVLASLRKVATSTGAGGTVQLSLASPVRARYLLIWFTTLPADSSGTYQASVYAITVKGQS
ncbi:MAG: helix-turn-helix domain-containing protein [Streptosporangiaceae bacterium]